MSDVRVKLRIRDIRKLLKSNPVQSEVARRARRIANAAGPGFKSVVKPAKFTSRAFVQTDSDEARKRQAEQNVLQRSLDAGR